MRFPLNIGDFNLRKNGDHNLQINSMEAIVKNDAT